VKTVYLDNNCYKGLLDNQEAYDFLLSLSHNRRGAFSFESSLATLEEFSLIFRKPEPHPRYVKLVRLAHRLVRRDRCLRDVVDLMEQEVAIAFGERSFVDPWYHRGSREYALWRHAWHKLRRGRVLNEKLLKDIDDAKAEYKDLFEEMRQDLQARLRDVKDTPEQLGALIHRHVREKGLDFTAQVAKRQFARLPSSLDETRQIVITYLHALRTEMGLHHGFGFARLAPNVKQIIVDMSMRGRGRHEGGEFYDVRHGTSGRYVDYFVTDEVTLRFIINSLSEQNYRGLTYHAVSLSEFLEEAERLAQS